jgi:UDP-glucose 4-epimerase
VQLLQNGHDVIILDNLCNSKRSVLNQIERFGGKRALFVEGDIRDEALLAEILHDHAIEAVIHFAGLKAVGESVREPLKYYHNNLVGTLNLIRVMDRHNVRSIVFSSSATVYGEHNPIPYVEKMEIGANNPYGRTKEQIEDILADLGASDERWSIALLRYFNPVGAHESGRIGEDPTGVPNNLLPFVAQVAVGRREKVMVFGSDYPTPDGTGVRDYIHVMDLAAGHLAALDYIAARKGVKRWNLGTGNGSSVLEVLAAFSKAAGKDVPYELAPRRPGDAAVSYADPAAAKADLGWTASRSLEDMCRDHWNWQKQNPQGYASQA